MPVIITESCDQTLVEVFTCPPPGLDQPPYIGVNIGGAPGEVYSDTDQEAEPREHRFRTLTGTGGTTVTVVGDTVVIDTEVIPESALYTGVNLGTGADVYKETDDVPDPREHKFRSIVGEEGVIVTEEVDEIIVSLDPSAFAGARPALVQVTTTALSCGSSTTMTPATQLSGLQVGDLIVWITVHNNINSGGDTLSYPVGWFPYSYPKYGANWDSTFFQSVFYKFATAADLLPATVHTITLVPGGTVCSYAFVYRHAHTERPLSGLVANAINGWYNAVPGGFSTEQSVIAIYHTEDAVNTTPFPPGSPAAVNVGVAPTSYYEKVLSGGAYGYLHWLVGSRQATISQDENWIPGETPYSSMAGAGWAYTGITGLTWGGGNGRFSATTANSRHHMDFPVTLVAGRKYTFALNNQYFGWNSSAANDSLYMGFVSPTGVERGYVYRNINYSNSFASLVTDPLADHGTTWWVKGYDGNTSGVPSWSGSRKVIMFTAQESGTYNVRIGGVSNAGSGAPGVTFTGSGGEGWYVNSVLFREGWFQPHVTYTPTGPVIAGNGNGHLHLWGWRDGVWGGYAHQVAFAVNPAWDNLPLARMTPWGGTLLTMNAAPHEAIYIDTDGLTTLPYQIISNMATFATASVEVSPFLYATRRSYYYEVNVLSTSATWGFGARTNQFSLDWRQCFWNINTNTITWPDKTTATPTTGSACAIGDKFGMNIDFTAGGSITFRYYKNGVLAGTKTESGSSGIFDEFEPWHAFVMPSISHLVAIAGLTLNLHGPFGYLPAGAIAYDYLGSPEVVDLENITGVGSGVPILGGTAENPTIKSLIEGTAIDITGTATEVTIAFDPTEVPNDSFSFAQLQNIATNKLLGRSTAATGDIEQIGIGTGLALSGGTLSSSGASVGYYSQIVLGDSASVYYTCDNVSGLPVDLVAASLTASVGGSGTTYNQGSTGVRGRYVTVTTTSQMFWPMTAGAVSTNPAFASCSLEAWFKSTSSLSTVGVHYNSAFLIGSDTGSGGNYVCLGLHNACRPIFGFASTSVVGSTGTYNDGLWHHVVATRNSTTGAVVIYVDGAVYATGTLGTGNANSQPTNFWTGLNAIGFAGSVQHIAVYNSILTATQVKTHYSAGYASLGAGGGAMATDTLWDAAGDLAYGTGADTGARLAIGTTGQVLTVAGGLPSWAAASGGGGSGTTVNVGVQATPYVTALDVSFNNAHTGWTSDLGTWTDNAGYMSSVPGTGIANRLYYTTPVPQAQSVIECEVYYDSASALGTSNIAVAGIRMLTDGVGTGDAMVKIEWTNKASAAQIGLETQGVANYTRYNCTAPVDTWHRLTAVVGFNHFDLYLNGTFIGMGYCPGTNTTDPRYVGLACYQGTFRFRNFKVYRPALPSEAGISTTSNGITHPDAPPVTPDAMDDEFEGSTLASKWTWRNQGSATAAVAGGALVITAPVGASVSMRVLEQTVSGNFKVRTKMSLVAAGNYSNAALTLFNDASGKGLILDIYYNAANDARIVAQRFASASSFNANMYSATSAYALVTPGLYTTAPLYVEAEYDGTNIVFRTSPSGVEGTFTQIYTETAAAYMGTPDRVGIAADCQSASLIGKGAFEWFRKISSTYSPGKLLVNTAPSGIPVGTTSVDAPPVAVDASDDEFEGTSLNTNKWTWTNQSTATAVVAGGALLMTSAIGASESHNTIYQSISGSFKYRTKMHTYFGGATSGAGMLIGNASSGKYYAIGIYYNASNDHRLYVKALTNLTTLSSNVYLSGSAGAGATLFGQTIPHYLEIEYDGTTLYFRMSESGQSGTFVLLYSIAAATFLGTPDRVGLHVDSENASNAAVAAFEWFRKIGSSYTPGQWMANGLSSSTTLDALSDVVAPTAVDGQVLVYNAASNTWRPGYLTAPSAALQYVGQAIVAGSAATTLTISGLDLATDGHYEFDISVKNASGSTSTFAMYFNADTTAVDYDSTRHAASVTTDNSTRSDTAQFFELLATGMLSVAHGDIITDLDGRTRVHGRIHTGNSTGQGLSSRVLTWETNFANVTSIMLSADVASAIAVGSYIRVWKRSTAGTAIVGASVGSTNVDAPPVIPDTMDDEFEGTTLASTWTWRNQGTATATVSHGALTMTSPVASGNNLRILEKSVTGTWKYRAKAAAHVLANFNTAGICVVNSSNGKVITHGKTWTTSEKFTVYKFSSVTTYSATAQETAWYARFGAVQQFVYFEIEYDGTTIYFRTSADGIVFDTYYSETAATFLGTPDKIGLVVEGNSASVAAIGVFDWFRKIGSSYTPGKFIANGNAVAGTWVTVATQTASASSSLDFTNVSAASYNQYMLVLDDLVLGTSGAELGLVAGTGATPTWDTGNNYDFFISWQYGTSGTGTASAAFVSATANIRFGTVASASSPHGQPMVGDAQITGLASGVNLRVSKGMTDVDAAGGLTEVHFSGVHNVTTEITGLRLIPSSGTITSGKARLLGRNF